MLTFKINDSLDSRLFQSLDDLWNLLFNFHFPNVLFRLESNLPDFHRFRFVQIAPRRVHNVDVVQLATLDAILLD